MTKIILHGILGKIFGKNFSLKISNPISAIRAIEANRQGFIKKIQQLANNNCHYSLIVDGEIVKEVDELKQFKKIKKIDFVPILTGRAVGLLLGGAFASAAMSAFFSIGISLVLNFLISLFTKKNTETPAQFIGVGGQTFSVEARGKSYIFSNQENVTSQGVKVPIGYGKLKIPSVVIEAGIKNYNTAITETNEFTQIENLIIFSDYISN
jgi:predicted phage tail protein